MHLGIIEFGALQSFHLGININLSSMAWALPRKNGSLS
jgi:hypothetical protein